MVSVCSVVEVLIPNHGAHGNHGEKRTERADGREPPIVVVRSQRRQPADDDPPVLVGLAGLPILFVYFVCFVVNS